MSNNQGAALSLPMADRRRQRTARETPKTYWNRSIGRDMFLHEFRILDELDELVGPAGSAVLCFLACLADASGGVTSDVYKVAEFCMLPREQARQALDAALETGFLYEYWVRYGVYGVQITSKSGYRFGRVNPTPKLRAAVLERDGLICQICGDGVARADVHLDHIYPVSRGGLTTLENLRVTHSACNRRKAARL